MEAFLRTITEFMYTAENTIKSVVSSIGFFDIVDIIILALVIFKIFEFYRDSRAKTLMKGIVLIIAMYILSIWLGMVGIHWILEKVIDYGLVILVIIFHPEIRRILERVGHSSLGIFGKSKSNVNEEEIKAINSVCKAVQNMSENKIGALIVFENKTSLGEIVNTGTVIDSSISEPIICNIFYPKSPLHDGAMIIRDGRIMAAACILPLSSNQDISLDLGTRHRAAIGISENSDAVTVVVSEESGKISLTRNGVITRGFNSQSLQQELYKIFITVDDNSESSLLNTIKKFFQKKDKDGEENA